jgi:phage-related protein
VKLIIYDILGKEITTLVDEKQNIGTYEIKFNMKNLSSGIYFYRLVTNDFEQTKRMMLLK